MAPGPRAPPRFRQSACALLNGAWSLLPRGRPRRGFSPPRSICKVLQWLTVKDGEKCIEGFVVESVEIDDLPGILTEFRAGQKGAYNFTDRRLFGRRRKPDAAIWSANGIEKCKLPKYVRELESHLFG